MKEQTNIATQYDGTFDTDFLANGEVVRLADKSSRAVEVFTQGRWMRVEKGDWLIRTIDGRLVNRKFI